jgi:hypothetical protein
LWQSLRYNTEKGDLTKDFIFAPLVEPGSAIFIPPKQDQAFNQGGTFLFDGNDTIFAHYDESTGAHSDIDQVMRLAKDRVQSKLRQTEIDTVN